MATCTNHPDVETAEACASCGRPFCAACLVDFMGRRTCGACRDQHLAQMHPRAVPGAPPTVADHIIPAKNPPALIGYYLGVFSLIPCLGNLLGPAALVLGIIGLRARARNPNLPGKGHALTAIILGALTTLAYWLVPLLLMIFVRSPGAPGR
jgi:hypothetical protein